MYSPSTEWPSLPPRSDSDSMFLDPRDVVALPPSLPPTESHDFEIMPEITYVQDIGVDPLATTDVQELGDPTLVSGVRIRSNRAGMSAEEISAGSIEYVDTRKALVDFLRSDEFRSMGCDAIPDTLINMLEMFHVAAKQHQTSEDKHDQEIAKLLNILNDTPEAYADRETRALQREGIRELSDFVREPFLCHGMWEQIQLRVSLGLRGSPTSTIDKSHAA